MEAITAPAEESTGSAVTTMIDQTYEFVAPRWFDFINGETEHEARRAELWFQSALSCAPSPSVPRIKARRSFKVETMCNFDEEEEEEEAKPLKDKEPSEPIAPTISSQPEPNLSEAKKEEVGHTAESTIKPSHNDSKDADASNFRDAATEQIENKENIPPPYTPKPPLQYVPIMH